MEKYTSPRCKYCNKESALNFAEALKCTTCYKYVHISCLKRQSVPGGIYGDTFFYFTCQECTNTDAELFVRKKMTWFQVIMLTMYHFQHKIAGTANKGYYHWRIHLVNFIDKKWGTLFTKDVKRRKNWMGTISGSLSHFSPCFFTSGTSVLGQNGWWKLTFPQLTPTTSVLIYNELTSNKQISLKVSQDIIYIEKLIRKYVPKLTMDNNYVPVRKKEFDGKLTEFIDDINIEVDVEDDLLLSPCKIFDSNNTFLQHDLNINQVLDYVAPANIIHRKQKKRREIPKVIFKQAKQNFYGFWKTQTKERKINSKCVALRKPEEYLLYTFMQQNCTKRKDIVLKRKLIVRFLKKRLSLTTLNIDMHDESTANIRARCYNSPEGKKNIKDKVIALGDVTTDEYLRSPFTNRVLKPFIRREIQPKSLWLQLMTELLDKQQTTSSVSSLDYVYVRPNHLPVIHSLCDQYFWPGIDLSECLEYPEFSCVVLYKKLVIAFAFMVPDAKINEAYISFVFTRPEWRRGGIATFMIYHLIQTCMGKDITLHVSINNPALFLYQKFGFKIEEVVLNFYDAYLQEDNHQSKHAYLLKLEK